MSHRDSLREEKPLETIEEEYVPFTHPLDDDDDCYGKHSRKNSYPSNEDHIILEKYL